MKSSATNTRTEMNDAGVLTSSNAQENVSTDIAAASVVNINSSNINQPKTIECLPGNLLHRSFADDGESAMDSSDHNTENEQHKASQHSQISPASEATGKKHRVKAHRKRDLINLQSNLNPKYIGFANANSPTAMPNDTDRMRSTRRRNPPSVATPNNSFGSVGSGRDNDSASPKIYKAGIHMLMSGAYLSPIDKLLIKNGAYSPNSTGFEADAEDVVVISPVRKQIKRKMKRGPKPNMKRINQNPEETDVKLYAEQIVQKDTLHSKEETVDDNYSPVTGEPEVSIKLETSEDDANNKIYETNNQSNNNVPEPKTKEQKNSESSPVESICVLPTATSTEIEPLKSPPDHIEQSNTSEQSIKSPSSVSMDSAKGSSIVTDPGWQSYQEGDIYWGKLFSYCYWPCIICPDSMGQIVVNQQSQRKSMDSVPGVNTPMQIHVRFFADNGRHNWIKSENLLPYAGLKAFEEMRDEVRSKHGSRSNKYRQMVASQNKLHVWHQAIEEANVVGQLPYSERMQKFYEIYEMTVTQNKEKRMVKKSMRRDTSDVGSSLYDSTDNLMTKTSGVTLKRERSSTPFSPAFSPVHNHQKRAKRRKLSDNVEEQVGYSSEPKTHHDDTLSSDCYNNPEFGELFEIIKEYVMVHQQGEKVEKILLAVVRNIWSLKQLQLRELERELTNGDLELLGSTRMVKERGRGVGTVRRLSNRLKTLMLRRSLTPVVMGNSNTTAAAASDQTTDVMEMESHMLEQAKPKKPTGRPIEEVIKDILQLDKKYLFRGLNRDPVCKYCYEQGPDVQRCARDCNNWMHASCLERQNAGNSIGGKGSKVAVAGPNDPHESVTSISLDPNVGDSATTVVEHVTGDEIIQDVNSDKEPLICLECASGKSNVCCICHQEESPSSSAPMSPQKDSSTAAINIVEEQHTVSKLMQCSQPMCSSKFHANCCRYWPQVTISNSVNRCPMHVCHTCVSDDPSAKYQQLGSAKLIKCVKCPATYHQNSSCIPAGSRMLSVTHLICPRHNVAKSDANLNVLWCYICVRGGELVCCETCPIAVHAHCRNIPIKTNESYICEECESGRLPLYGEIVWAKFNNFRWWPAIILPPTEIPNNILKKPHGMNDFVVRFFGTNDHGWISRRRVYLYIEGDTGDGNKGKSLISKRYTVGVEEATRFLQIIKQKRQEQTPNKLHPQPYVKIKTNKPVPPVRFVFNEEKLNICNCDPNDEHPCGPQSGCLNRILFHECHPEYCHAGSRCENQLFGHRKSPRLEVVYMNERGFGLVCREPIAKGDFIIEYVGEVINHKEFQRRMAQKTRDRDENFYFLVLEPNYIIDAGPKGNLARFMNHSCEPNCESQKWMVNCINRVGLFAIKDIPENTELTFNYLWDNLMNNGKKACFCGAKRCSGEIGGKLKDEEMKGTKLKQIRRQKGIRINVVATKKKLVKKAKSKALSTNNVPTPQPPSDGIDASKEQ